MALHTSGKISYGDAREEGNKSSWVSPNYPTIKEANRLNIDANWVISKDESNTVGCNTDGSFPITKVYGWDTWNRPSITNAMLIQINSGGDIRLYFEVAGGDALRSGYIIFVTGTKPSSWSDVSTLAPAAVIRHAPEFNPSMAQDYKYNKTYYPSESTWEDNFMRALGKDPNGNFPSMYSKEWGHNSDSSFDFDTAHRVDFLNYSDGIRIGFSVQVPAGVGLHYVSIVPFDGREDDVLGLNRSDNVFVVNYNGSNYSSFNRTSLKNINNVHQFGATPNGDGGINIYANIGNLFLSSVSDTTAVVSSDHPYETYQMLAEGTGDKWWYYLDEGANEIAPTPVSEANGWVQSQGFPIGVDGLNPSTSYGLTVAQKTGDGGGTNITDRFDFQTDSSTTNPQISFTNDSGFDSSIAWSCEWTEGGPNYTVTGFQTKVNNGSWNGTGAEINYDSSTDTYSSSGGTNPFPQSGDTVSLRAVYTDGVDNYHINIDTITA